ncbi:tRNA (adenosine(37)-N6)-threonylcarbamoyltransferase complex transferase subunit TsaD [Alphaproteobacteria bacterium]|nr:tRNA (adenosine(37)-N6)-threonylcarbamoyltransferase complex transferase subunit TsaD [Alphaproteobacteria bacterium]
MKILGIESSCDDTSIAIVDSDKNIIANEVLSQNNVHKEYKGIVPELAARNHVLFIDKVLKKILNKNNLSLNNIDLIAATAGPGLIGGLLVGLTFAKTLAQVNKIPFIGVNHLEGHALTSRLTDNIDYPFLLLLVSGGHTNFYFIEGINKYFYLGGTLDDAIGEAYDKVANILELGFPGGPNIEKLAKKGNESLISLPKPLIKKNNLDLSFSGLKTAVLNIIKNRSKNHIFSSADIAASFQKSISDILCKKITIAINIMNEKKVNYNNVVIAGGVAANKYLRKNLHNEVEKNNKKLFLPPVNLCTDNGAMIAWAGYELYKSGIRSNMNIRASPRWPLEEMKEKR